MFFHVSDEETPPSTPREINTLANPFSPSITSPRGEDLFSATFDAHFQPPGSTNNANLPADDPFDPFGTSGPPTNNSNLGNELDFFNSAPVIQPQQTANVNMVGSNDDLFGSFDTSGVSVFDVSSHQNNDSNGLANAQPHQYNDFDAFGVGGNLAADFSAPKVDPFADTPDWESVASVASEEVGGSSHSSAPHNPFSSGGSGNLTTNQNVDLFNASNTNTVTDPFGSSNQNSDPFGSTNQNSDPFGSTNQNSDLFGSTNVSSDLFSGSNNTDLINPFGSANQNGDIFGTTSQNTDLFANVSSTQDSFAISTNNNSDFFGSANQQQGMNNTMSQNPFANGNDLNSTTPSQGASHDIFSDYLNSKVVSRDFNNTDTENPFHQPQMTPTNETNNITSFGDDFPSLNEQVTHMNINEHHEDGDNIDFTMTQPASSVSLLFV